MTGASRGIGRATVQALAKEGAHVIVHYGRSEAKADAVVTEIRAAGGRAESLWLQIRARWITGAIIPVDGGSKL